MEIVLTLILLTLWLIITAVIAVAAFYFGSKAKPKQEPRAAPEPNEEENRKALRQEKETFNMLTYSGDEQDDIII